MTTIHSPIATPTMVYVMVLLSEPALLLLLLLSESALPALLLLVLDAVVLFVLPVTVIVLRCAASTWSHVPTSAQAPQG